MLHIQTHTHTHITGWLPISVTDVHRERMKICMACFLTCFQANIIYVYILKVRILAHTHENVFIFTRMLAVGKNNIVLPFVAVCFRYLRLCNLAFIRGFALQLYA